MNNTQEAMDSPRRTDCTCGHQIVVTREIQESPQGTPIHCPACQKVWRAWQLIVRSAREARP